MSWREEAEAAAKASKDKVLATYMQGALAELQQQDAKIMELHQHIKQIEPLLGMEMAPPYPDLRDQLKKTEARLLEVREAIRFALRNPQVLAPIVLVKLRSAVQEP